MQGGGGKSRERRDRCIAWWMVAVENWTAVLAILCLVGLLVAIAKCIESREAAGAGAATSSRQEVGGQKGYGTVKTECKSEGNKFITDDDL